MAVTITSEGPIRHTFTEWAANHADLVSYVIMHGQTSRNRFLRSIHSRVSRGHRLSPRQVEVTENIMRADRFYQARAEHVHAAIEAQREQRQPAPTGDGIAVDGTVLLTNCAKNPHGPGVRYSMLVLCQGWRVWCSIPKALQNADQGSPGNHFGLIDHRVTFRADLRPDAEDPTLAYAVQPRQALIRPVDEHDTPQSPASQG